MDKLQDKVSVCWGAWFICHHLVSRQKFINISIVCGRTLPLLQPGRMNQAGLKCGCSDFHKNSKSRGLPVAPVRTNCTILHCLHSEMLLLTFKFTPLCQWHPRFEPCWVNSKYSIYIYEIIYVDPKNGKNMVSNSHPNTDYSVHSWDVKYSGTEFWLETILFAQMSHL